MIGQVTCCVESTKGVDLGNNIEVCLKRWLAFQNLGKKERTRDFNEEVVTAIRNSISDLDRTPSSITAAEVAQIAAILDHYCPSRWNLIVSALRSLTPHANVLKRKKIKFRSFTPPTKEQFARLLVECDRLPRSHAGLVVRFLVLTGLRICEARALRWENVGADRIHVPSEISKNGLPRSVPFLPGASDTLEKLRAVTNGNVLPSPSFRNGLEKACERAGLPILSYHCFRHMFATNCIEAGVDLPTVARWLGHSDGGALLARMYFHLLDGHSMEMAARVKVV